MRIFVSAYVRFPNALAWHALEVCRGLHEAGHEVHLFCQRGSPLASWSEDEPFPVNRELNPNRFDPKNVIRSLSIIRRALREHQPDILNPHCPPGHSYFALARLLESSPAGLIRTVAEPRPPKVNLVNRRLHERHTDGVILTTDSSRQRYSQRFSLDHAPVVTILPGFRAEDFVQDMKPGNYRSRLKLKDGQLLAGIVARMSPEKGQETLLEALSLLPVGDREQIHVAIAGKDSRERTRDDLEAIAKGLDVDRYVTFLGPLDDVRPLLRELDLGIITSTRSEAICRIALEYMSVGIPIIASDVNILPEVVRDGENGWVFANRSAGELARGLQSLLAHREELKRRGKIGYNLARGDFAASNEIAQIVRVYESVRRARKAL